MSFSENLRNARKKRGMSQDQLAEELGVSRQSVSKWESDVAYPELDRMVSIAQILNVTTDSLLMDFKDEHTVSNQERNDLNGEIADKEAGKYGKRYIIIKSYDHKSVVNCMKVAASPLLYPTKKEPKFILNGVDRTGFFGDHNTILGFYDSEESIMKEIDEIHDAMQRGEQFYELKYYVNVVMNGISVKLQ